MQNNINCSVESCKHNGVAKTCQLNAVSVGSCVSQSPEATQDTQCASFECC